MADVDAALPSPHDRRRADHPGVPETTQAAWIALKLRFDPDRIMNPGVLGL